MRLRLDAQPRQFLTRMAGSSLPMARTADDDDDEATIALTNAAYRLSTANQMTVSQSATDLFLRSRAWFDVYLIGAEFTPDDKCAGSEVASFGRLQSGEYYLAFDCDDADCYHVSPHCSVITERLLNGCEYYGYRIGLIVENGTVTFQDEAWEPELGGAHKRRRG